MWGSGFCWRDRGRVGAGGAREIKRARERAGEGTGRATGVSLWKLHYYLLTEPVLACHSFVAQWTYETPHQAALGKWGEHARIILMSWGWQLAISAAEPHGRTANIFCSAEGTERGKDRPRLHMGCFGTINEERVGKTDIPQKPDKKSNCLSNLNSFLCSLWITLNCV